MRIDLTLAAGGGERDVAVLTPAPLTFARVRGALAAAAGLPDATAWWCDGQPLAAAEVFGGTLLRHGAVLTPAAPTAPRVAAGYTLDVAGGPSSGLSIRLGRGEVTIGRDPRCTLALDDARVSRRHAAVSVSGSTARLRDLGSTNGTTVDGARVGEVARDVPPGSVVRVGDSTLRITRPPTPLPVSGAGGRLLVSRPPRVPYRVPAAELELPAEPGRHRPHPVQWLAAAGPLVLGVAISVLTHSTLFLLFAALSPVMIACGAVGDRLHWRRSRRRALAEHAATSAAAGRDVAAALEAEAAVRRAASPDPPILAAAAALPGTRLWERRAGDADVLAVRLGMGPQESITRVRGGSAVRAAGTLPDVPLAAGLAAGPLGLSGAPDAVDGVARWVVVQLATLHSPADLEIVLLLSPDAEARWRWARWLPHVRRLAALPDDLAPLIGELTDLVTARRRAHRGNTSWAGGRTVLIVDRGSALAGAAGLLALLADGPAVGVTAVWVDVDEALLPDPCTTLARLAGDHGTEIVVDPPGSVAIADRVGVEWAERVARSLAPLSAGDGGATASLPRACGLLELLGAQRPDAAWVARRWAAGGGRPRAPIGVAADGPGAAHLAPDDPASGLRDTPGTGEPATEAPATLDRATAGDDSDRPATVDPATVDPATVDLAADGPHALVAGTTGAGKSELLRTLVAGLALACPPETLTFLLVDYKGGAAFADCARLPHSVGLVTDLDPHLTARALACLEAELRARERLFATAGVADLAAYRASMPTTALPRLVIVVDEFATLAQELPDFVAGLVAVARRGRSLGIHLVLATQRPGTAVSPDIRANTSLRIALRVTDPAESLDIVDSPAAALIERGYPGRALVRCGERLRLVQTALVSGAAPRRDDEPVVVGLDGWRRPVEPRSVPEQPGSSTELAVITDAIRAAADGRPAPRRPWLPPLPAVIEADLVSRAGPLEVAIGVLDLPDQQAQPPLVVDLAVPAALLVIGGPGSGRTSALRTLAHGAARAGGEICVLDTAGPLCAELRAVPHVTTCLGPDDLSLVPTLLQRLSAAMGRRTATGALPMVLLVDGWDRVLAAAGDGHAFTLTEALSDLLRAAPAGGLTVMVTGDRSLLTPRVAGAFEDRLVLPLADRADYLLAGVPARAVPAQPPPGRAVRVSDAAECQLLSPPAFGGAGLASRPAARSPHAVVVRPLPRSVALADLPGDGLYLGTGGDRAEPVRFDPFRGARHRVVAGPPRSGRSTTLATLLAQAVRDGTEVIVAAPARSPLVARAAASGVPVIDPRDGHGSIRRPGPRALLLVDDSERFLDTPAGDELNAWVRQPAGDLAVVLAGRCDDLATTYRGLAAEVRRSRCGLLLRPGPGDGDLLGVRLVPAPGPVGRGVLVGEPAWGPLFESGEPLPVQVAA